MKLKPVWLRTAINDNYRIRRSRSHRRPRCHRCQPALAALLHLSCIPTGRHSFNQICQNVALFLPSIVISPTHRLATSPTIPQRPPHRSLPGQCFGLWELAKDMFYGNGDVGAALDGHAGGMALSDRCCCVGYFIGEITRRPYQIMQNYTLNIRSVILDPRKDFIVKSSIVIDCCRWS